VESIATQTLIIYVIRTRRVPFFRSRPSLPMLLVPTAAAAVGIVLPFTGLSHLLGFTPLPAAFFLVLIVLIVAYMVLVDVAKALFYRAHDARPAVPSAQPSIPGTQPATDPRSVRRLHRWAAPFTVKVVTGPGRWLLRPGVPTGKPAHQRRRWPRQPRRRHRSLSLRQLRRFRMPCPGTVLAVPQVRVSTRWISCSRGASLEMQDTGVAGIRSSQEASHVRTD
jgi:hypothetical protein